MLFSQTWKQIQFILDPIDVGCLFLFLLVHRPMLISLYKISTLFTPKRKKPAFEETLFGYMERPIR